MQQIRDDEWRELCRAAAVEPDPKKLIELVTEINRQLEERDKNLRAASKKRKDGNQGLFGVIVNDTALPSASDDETWAGPPSTWRRSHAGNDARSV